MKNLLFISYQIRCSIIAHHQTHDKETDQLTTGLAIDSTLVRMCSSTRAGAVGVNSYRYLYETGGVSLSTLEAVIKLICRQIM